MCPPAITIACLAIRERQRTVRVGLDDIEIKFYSKAGPITEFNAACVNRGSEFLNPIRPRWQSTVFKNKEVTHGSCSMRSGSRSHGSTGIMQSDGYIVDLGIA